MVKYGEESKEERRDKMVKYEKRSERNMRLSIREITRET
jgi:hypothetical protein